MFLVETMRRTNVLLGLLVASLVAIGALMLAEPRSQGIAQFAGTDPANPCETYPIAWRDSRPLGLPFKGRLARGVQLPPEGEHFFSWDNVLHVAPNRGWRRWGADGTIRVALDVLCDFRLAHPEAPRIGIGDLSRPRGGFFGKRYGGLGHASHQNGTDIDIYYPRLDRLERPPTRVSQIDRALAQDLVRRFVATRARYVFVGPRTGLAGPRRVVKPLVHHDNHIHVRFPAGIAAPPGPPPVESQ
jgi:murein endopeptidase